eukprot:6198170-Pleurochrysis_carterae.AAC.1
MEEAYVIDRIMKAKATAARKGATAPLSPKDMMKKMANEGSTNEEINDEANAANEVTAARQRLWTAVNNKDTTTAGEEHDLAQVICRIPSFCECDV